jgi:Asp-tRNA(Asn)/Glu-tRNA(Gln) amidotransferase A subunit family amidase
MPPDTPAPDWFGTARADAEQRGLPQVASVLDALRVAAERLRGADWQEHAATRDDAGAPATSSGPRLATTAGAPAASTAARSLLSGLTIVEAAHALRTGARTSAELTESALAAIAADNPRLNAFILVTADLARRQAAAADDERRRGIDRGPLHGIPISLKDLVDVAGLPTTAASRVRAGHVAAVDAPLVTRLRDAGAVIVGKTNLHEFALGTTSEASAYGPVLHPRDVSRSPGGSSGGSAASVVADMCLATIGSDTGGSIRIPAALCGLVGLKAAFGEVPCDGVVPLSRRLDHVGPLARSVRDARLLFEILSGRAVTTPAAPAAAASVRVGVVGGYALAVLQDEVRRPFEAAVARLREAGLAMAPAEVPRMADAPAIYLPLVLAEAAALHAETLEAWPELYTAPVRTRLELGRYVTGEDYVRALAGADRLRADVDAALATCDVLLLPTIPIVAPPLGAGTLRIADADQPVRGLMLRLTQPFNLTRHPAITLPVPPGSGLPVGLQLVGTNTSRLLDAAAVVEGLLQ